MEQAAVGAITLFVEDVARSQSFYERVFSTRAVFEDETSAAIRLENTILNLLVRPSAPELVEPAPVAAAGAGAAFQLTVFVEDADAECGRLRAAGATLLNGPLDREWGMRTAAFADPDGHVWELAQPLR